MKIDTSHRHLTAFDAHSLLIAAQRYYQGRCTIGAASFAWQLAEAWPTIPAHTRNILKRDLEEAFKDDDQARARGVGNRPLGMDCDRAGWELARQGMDAAKHHGSHMEAEAKRLHAECNPKALESERQANAELTEELEALRGELDALREQLGKAERLAEYESKSFRIFCHAIQRLEEIVGIDTGGFNGPGPAIGEVERIVKERDALAAHVIELRSELRDRAVQAWCDCEHPACKRCRDDAETEIVLARRPTTSLARTKAEWQAEALDNALEKLVPRMLTKADAQIVRDTIRSIKTPGSRRAEESAE